ncbi:MAG: FGGY-family carbohydrate kinase [Gammaproteobacteria bacterium]|nr:FGGY-family carbohydrate kinase [Gammaproteobacteria bacterium]
MVKTTVIGIDLGTSGCRAVAIDAAGRLVAEGAVPLPPSQQEGVAVQQSPQHWWQAIEQLMPPLLEQLDPGSVTAIAVDGTSGSVLLADAEGNPLTPALMYNDNRARSQAEQIGQLAPRDSAAHGTGSGLAKLLWLLEHHTLPVGGRVHTQADWISGRLSERYGYCDANNALKLGYDPIAHRWPEWMHSLPLAEGLLPRVVAPGAPIGPLSAELADRWGLSPQVMVCSGTTDSTAAFIASGAGAPGEAVTSLGSTLVLKVIAERPVFAPEYGVYSQPLGEYWLVGGSSNSGGAVLRHYFSDEKMAVLTPQLQPDQPTGLDYYPLLTPGERFPFNDPDLPPRLTPRPEDDLQFLQGLLEGIAAIEKAGYDRLAALGAPYPVAVRSNGGGAKNRAWTAIRGRMLGVSMHQADAEEACYGTALLAKRCRQLCG